MLLRRLHHTSHYLIGLKWRGRGICAKSEQTKGTTAAPQPVPSNEKPVDIGSIPDPHTQDPLKWRKFAWKYVGATAVFLASFKALRWYVEKLEKEGVRKREDVEINKTAVYETAADRAAKRALEAAKQENAQNESEFPVVVPEAIVPFGVRDPADLSSTAKVTDVSKLSLTDVEEQTKDSATDVASGLKYKIVSNENSDSRFRVFRPVEEEDGFVSQEDELRLLEIELETKLKRLRSITGRSSENDAEKKGVKKELTAVRAELASLIASDLRKAASD